MYLLPKTLVTNISQQTKILKHISNMLYGHAIRLVYNIFLINTRYVVLVWRFNDTEFLDFECMGVK